MAEIVNLQKMREAQKASAEKTIAALDADIAKADAAGRDTAAETSPVAASADQRNFEDLPPAMQRALTEAQERREKAEADAAKAPKEINGRGGLDPARYGDWEAKGITSDF